jgi:hypothetical protein
MEQESFEVLVKRVRAEFREMPGLRLTFEQIRRLWMLDRTTCDALVSRLTDARILVRTAGGHYVRYRSDEIHLPDASSARDRSGTTV